jgi:hypothetical protein
MANTLLPSDPVAIVGYIVSTIILWVSSVVVYRRWLHPLAKIPGPFWASVTHFYIVKYNLFSERSQFYKQIEKLHEEYGEWNLLGKLNRTLLLKYEQALLSGSPPPRSTSPIQITMRKSTISARKHLPKHRISMTILD